MSLISAWPDPIITTIDRLVNEFRIELAVYVEVLVEIANATG